MRRALVLLVALLGLASSAGTANAAGTDGMTARMTSGAQVPFRIVLLGLPHSAAVTSGSVHLRENGQLVRDVTVVPASGAASGQFGVVLVIDASDSMHGDPVTQATAAARVFADKIPASTRLAVLTFNSTSQVVLPFTNDPVKIQQALAAPPPVAHGTHIYDAVEAAVTMVHAAKIPHASVVVLSDGADTGSSASLSQAATDARRSGITVYDVGLKSKAFDSTSLQGLADQAGGTYTEATSPEALAGIYNSLGEKVANQYLIRYRTSQPAGTHVQVSVQVDGFGYAQTAYALPGAVAGGAFHRSLWAEFWHSSTGMLAIVALAAALFSFAVMSIMRPKPSNVRARVGEFVNVPIPTPRRPRESTSGGSSTMLTAKLAEGAERSLGNTGYWNRFKRDIEIAEVETQPTMLLMAGLVGAIGLGWLLVTLTGYPILGLLGLVALLLPGAYVQSRLRKKRTAFAEQLPDNLQVMASAMRAGHSFIGALAVVTEDSPEPSASEFRRVVADEQLGVSLEDALGSAVERMDNRDLAQVALVAALQRETGGNTAEVIDRVTETIRERFQLRRLVKTLTAQGRMSRWIVSALPIGLLLIITAINPRYEQPLYTNPVGRLLLVIAACLIIAGSLVIRRIVNIKV